MKDKRVKVKDNAIGVVGSMGKDAKPAVPTLCLLLRKDPKETIRVSAAIALGHRCEVPRPAILALRTAIQNNPSKHVRTLAAGSTQGYTRSRTIVEVLL